MPVYKRDMTITHREFLRLLPFALDGVEYQQRGKRIEVSTGRGDIRISLGKESTRHLGSLELPSTRVRLELAGFSDEGEKEFLKRFDLAYQKGGG